MIFTYYYYFSARYVVLLLNPNPADFTLICFGESSGLMKLLYLLKSVFCFRWIVMFVLFPSVFWKFSDVYNLSFFFPSFGLLFSSVEKCCERRKKKKVVCYFGKKIEGMANLMPAWLFFPSWFASLVAVVCLYFFLCLNGITMPEISWYFII